MKSFLCGGGMQMRATDDTVVLVWAESNYFTKLKKGHFGMVPPIEYWHMLTIVYSNPNKDRNVIYHNIYH